MIISTYKNSLRIDNGGEFRNPIAMEIVTLSDGSRTDFIFSLPDEAIIQYPRKATKRRLALPLVISVAPKREADHD